MALLHDHVDFQAHSDYLDSIDDAVAWLLAIHVQLLQNSGSSRTHMGYSILFDFTSKC